MNPCARLTRLSRRAAVRSADRSPPETAGEKTIAEQELINSLGWIIKMRWWAGAAVLVLTFVLTAALEMEVPTFPLASVGLGLFLYNAALAHTLTWMHRNCDSTTAYQWFARLQVALDWLSMTVLIHYSGGICSPVLVFFMFHITISSLLLPHDRAFLYVGLAPLLVGAVAVAEYYALLPHFAVLGGSTYRDPLQISATLFFFTCAAYVMAYFSMTISRRLRRRENEITGLYLSVRSTTSTLNVRQVMKCLTEAAAKVLDCKAASIRLLDKDGSHLEMVAAHGLSETYMDHAVIPLASALIDREALSGKTVLISDAPNDPRVRCPDGVRKEGIQSILSAPLIGKSGLIGVLRAYGGTGHRFTERDADFLGIIATQGAVAIENAQAYGLLEDLSRQKQQFVGMVTHELRSPIQVAANLLGVLSRNYLGKLNSKQADLVQRVQSRMGFLESLVDDLLNLAAGRADVLATAQRGPVVLREVLTDLSDRFARPAQTKRLNLGIECTDPSIAIWGRRDELGRLLDNLVGNAVKYTAKGGVRVKAQREGSLVRIEISDTGIGIPAEAVPHIYEEFFRAENAKAVEARGTGLGLAIVRDLLRRYDGKIDVESVEGLGTTFTVRIPLVPDALDSAAHSQDAP